MTSSQNRITGTSNDKGIIILLGMIVVFILSVLAVSIASTKRVSTDAIVDSMTWMRTIIIEEERVTRAGLMEKPRGEIITDSWMGRWEKEWVAARSISLTGDKATTMDWPDYENKSAGGGAYNPG